MWSYFHAFMETTTTNSSNSIMIRIIATPDQKYKNLCTSLKRDIRTLETTTT